MFNLGFALKSLGDLERILAAISCEGGSALYNAIEEGTNLLLSLLEFLSTNRAADSWRFVHIIITNGENGKSTLYTFNIFQLMSRLKVFPA